MHATNYVGPGFAVTAPSVGPSVQWSQKNCCLIYSLISYIVPCGIVILHGRETDDIGFSVTYCICLNFQQFRSYARLLFLFCLSNEDQFSRFISGINSQRALLYHSNSESKFASFELSSLIPRRSQLWRWVFENLAVNNRVSKTILCCFNTVLIKLACPWDPPSKQVPNKLGTYGDLTDIVQSSKYHVDRWRI